MNKLSLFKKLLPGLLPLFVFIAVEEFAGTFYGIIAAIIFGVILLIYTYIKDKVFDKFILLDTVLIMALGGVSILFDNDTFFKLKPALIQSIIVVILGVSAFSPNNIMLNMSRRYMADMKFTEVHLVKMRNNIRIMFYIFFIHTLFIFYSVYYMSNEAWAFISGGLFYIIFGVYLLFEIIRNKYFRDRDL